MQPPPSPLRSGAAVQLGENRHCGSVGTGHLNGEGSFNFILQRCGFDHRQRRIHVGSEMVAKGDRAAGQELTRHFVTGVTRKEIVRMHPKVRG